MSSTLVRLVLLQVTVIVASVLVAGATLKVRFGSGPITPTDFISRYLTRL